MNAKWFLAAGLAVGMCGCAKLQAQRSTEKLAGTDAQVATDAQVDAVEAKVKLEQTPPAVQEIIQREIAGGELEDIAKQTFDGRILYEVDIFRKEGGKLELRLAADGKLLSKKSEK